MIVRYTIIVANNCGLVNKEYGMNPFYEIRRGKLQMGLAESLSFPEHLHNHMEMLYVTEGCIEVSVMGRKQLLFPGDCAVIFPEQIHSYTTGEKSLMFLLIFETALTGAFLHSVQKHRPVNPFLTAGNLHSDVPAAFRRLNEADIQDNILLGSAWIQVILAHLLPCLMLEEAKQPESAELTYRLVQYIMKHFKEPLSLDILARELHVNKYYLSHTFSERLQMSFPQYINRIRLEYALQAMRSTDKTLTAIWADAGFESQRSFNRTFLTVMGITPSEYRKL